MKFDGYYEPIQIENPEIIQCAEGKTNPYAGEEGQLSKSRGFYCPFTFENPEEQARIDQEVAEARQQKDRKTGVEVMKCEALDIVNHGREIQLKSQIDEPVKAGGKCVCQVEISRPKTWQSSWLPHSMPGGS